MTPNEVINECQKSGVILSMDAKGGLAYRGPKDATTRLLPTIKQHKPELLALLAGRMQKKPEPAEIWVIAFTPLGEPITVKARDAGHAEQIRRVNPAPDTQGARDHPTAEEPTTHAAMVRCCACLHALTTAHPVLVDCGRQQPAPGSCGPFRWWGNDFHVCNEFERAGQ